MTKPAPREFNENVPFCEGGLWYFQLNNAVSEAFYTSDKCMLALIRKRANTGPQGDLFDAV